MAEDGWLFTRNNMLLQIVSDSPLKMYSNVAQPNCTFVQPHTYCVGWKITFADHYFELSVFSEFDCHNVISSSATCITCVYSILYYGSNIILPGCFAY